ncbi:high-affinity branched-chain amino acid ABC transporter permease LivM [Kluyvera sp. NPDC087067]|uniref:high-affinity branched-chain amino acid ABC transporter permease LivM n=1 Tax=Kluyvera sp. NPDC087067 TaxID=3364105 RepID=UPI003811EB0B
MTQQTASHDGFSLKRCILDTVFSGLVALILFGPIVGVVLDGYSFNFEGQRLVWIIAAVMVGRFILSAFLMTSAGRRIAARFEGDSAGVYVRPVGYKSRMRWIIPLVLALAICFPFVATKYVLTVAILGLIYVLLGLGLNIVVGLAGLLDLGYVAFYAIGAYGLALGYQYLGLGFWSMLPLAALMAAAAGALLGFPVLRMHGDYLAIVTLGFGEIIRLVLNNWLSFTGGPNGISAPPPTFFGLEFGRRAKDGGVPFHEFFHLTYNPNLKFIFIYAVLVVVVLTVLYIKHRLTRMPIGRAWEALREDEIACRSLGLNHVLVKLSAFTLGASTAGIAGVFFATYQGFVNPTSFTFFESALILAIVVLGGMGSTVGVVLAAFVLTVTPELLRSFAEYRVLLFGVLMVVMMIWRPRGLIRINRSGFATRKGVAP